MARQKHIVSSFERSENQCVNRVSLYFLKYTIILKIEIRSIFFFFWFLNTISTSDDRLIAFVWLLVDMTFTVLKYETQKKKIYQIFIKVTTFTFHNKKTFNLENDQNLKSQLNVRSVVNVLIIYSPSPPTN